MSFYSVDRTVLRTDEETRHRSAVNAAISAGRTVVEAFDLADEAVREYRHRIEIAFPPATPKKYALNSDAERVDGWFRIQPNPSPKHNNVLRAMREAQQPMYLAELTKLAQVGNETVRQLVEARVLVPVEEEG